MSRSPHNDLPDTEPYVAHRPEIQHPRPTRPLATRRVTIAAMVDAQDHSPWSHYTPATNTPTEHVETRGGNGIPTPDNGPRSPSAPAALNRPPSPPSLTIHSILTVPPALRSRPRVRLIWDVRYSPDTLPLTQPGRRDSITSHHSASTTQSLHSNPGTTASTQRIRLRSNTQPGPDLELASDLYARLNLNYNSHTVTEGLSPISPNEAEAPQPFANNPLAFEPATSPPRGRMLIICRDLLDWFIPIYARDPAVGCTVLEVVRGIYKALQKRGEVPGHTRSASDGTTRAVRGWRRVEWLRDKTVFACIERDDALARRRVPTIPTDDVFVLRLRRKD
ncbi:unnamed protein product [Rhizoctonia solani]|uniref:DUF6699 domain-containing protein n=3 Tax=Rhizoctonia solani TaxID=456999 RepID=A0A8H2X129_9AGAM|nr:hypothetical protein RSOL_396600 [Rhizoctonia solani AG-3 Rhs1AP]KEP53546.1 hypothetical protein V565_029210 [Rhizoctonia solani 123E]CAE6415246.1 unnamed protein product [Rhizoctonia solani]CAE6518614.1 unnamed protein product [Rhizoctonia solani]